MAAPKLSLNPGKPPHEAVFVSNITKGFPAAWATEVEFR